MTSEYNYYTVGDLLEELENDTDFANGEFSYYIENGEIKY